MIKQFSKISSHSQFQPLQEVLVGGTYPDSFYEHFDSKTQDIFYKINELTREDFKKLIKTLRNVGVNTVEPKFTRVDDYLDEHDNLIKPPISPCDFSLTLADTMYMLPCYPSGIEPYQYAIDQYRANGQNVKILDRSTPDPLSWVVFPSFVKTGRDLIIDYDPFTPERSLYATQVAQELSKNYRVHLSATGDHCDGVFCPVKPGHLLITHWYDEYKQSFPGWETFQLKNNAKQPGGGEQWWVTGLDYAVHNKEVNAVAETWLGCPEETVFDVNNLVIDENNIIISSMDDETAEFYESIGMTPHIVDFKTKHFWDAGIHCVTSDVHRLGNCEDYWPNRGENGIYEITEWI